MTELETRIIAYLRGRGGYYTAAYIARQIGAHAHADDVAVALEHFDVNGLVEATDLAGIGVSYRLVMLGAPAPNQEVYADVQRGDEPAPLPGMTPAAAPIDDPGPHTLSLSTACLAPDTFDAWWETRDLDEKADIFRTYHEELSREQEEESSDFAVGSRGNAAPNKEADLD